MPITKLNPYLFFNGDCAEAIAHYEQALGAIVESRQTFAEIPGAPPSPHGARIMKASLRVGPAVVLLSDTHPDTPVPLGGNVDVMLDFDDAAETADRFARLGRGGTVTMPLAEMFPGASFGTVVDRFGVNWMFTCVTPL
ncbi:MAG: glyoxalase/bleomycin resistance/extradiol dioxygenase family protein [Deltaproteobacteria bacterium]|nr:glyoxalase/bleomycin resistance/extradiol dioxygenase family protein [Deltaproteobacteria bacterium]